MNMPIYTLKLRVPIGDMVCVKVEVPDLYHVGQMVSIEPAHLPTVRGPNGILTPGSDKAIMGTVICKA